MADEILQLHRTPPQNDIVAGLRKVADRLEAEGAEAYDMEAVTTATLVLGHTTSKLLSNDEIERAASFEVFSWGPRTDIFTVRGLLATVLKRW